MLLLWSTVLATLAITAWALIRLSRMAAIGSSYRSKVLASLMFGTNRALDPDRAEEVTADSYWPMRLFQTHVDPARRTVTTSLLGWKRRWAVHRPGLGATLFLSDPTGMPHPSRAVPPRTTAEASVPVRSTQTGPLRQSQLDDAIARAFTEPNPRRVRRTRAVLVLHDGEIVGERYASGFDASTPFAGWSMTKGVMNALVGILVGQGRLSLQDAGLMRGWRPPDPRALITVEDLLRMRSGLRFSEEYTDYSSDVIEMLFNQTDTAAYAASQPLTSKPGSVWSYSSGSTNILSAVIRRVVGDEEYLRWPRRVLFEPLGMTSAVLEPDAAGTFVCSSFMLATARDWARFGQLYLQDGVWNGQRILPEGWVTYSVTPTPPSLGGISGAHWRLKLAPEIGGGSDAASRIPKDAFFAVGHEGQTLTIIPSKRLVIVRLGLSIYIDAWNQAEFLAELLDALP